MLSPVRFHLSFPLCLLFKFLTLLSVSYGSSLYSIRSKFTIGHNRFSGETVPEKKNSWSEVKWHNQGPDIWILMPSPSLQASDSCTDIVPIIGWISHGIFLKGFHKCSNFRKCSEDSIVQWNELSLPSQGMGIFFHEFQFTSWKNRPNQGYQRQRSWLNILHQLKVYRARTYT